MKEKELQRFAEKLCAAYRLHFARIPNIVCRKINHTKHIFLLDYGNAWKNNGWPDLTILGPEGRALFMELKTEKGRLSETQEQFKKYCDDNGHNYIVCRNTDEIEAAVKELAKHQGAANG